MTFIKDLNTTLTKVSIQRFIIDHIKSIKLSKINFIEVKRLKKYNSYQTLSFNSDILKHMI